MLIPNGYVSKPGMPKRMQLENIRICIQFCWQMSSKTMISRHIHILSYFDTFQSIKSYLCHVTGFQKQCLISEKYCPKIHEGWMHIFSFWCACIYPPITTYPSIHCQAVLAQVHGSSRLFREMLDLTDLNRTVFGTPKRPSYHGTPRNAFPEVHQKMIRRIHIQTNLGGFL